MNNNLIISIGRECGSGGLEIGQKLADHYNIKLYDRNILDILAEKSNEPWFVERIYSKLVKKAQNGILL